MEATGTAAAASSVRWQLCYDVTAKTWWMVSGGARPGGGHRTRNRFWGGEKELEATAGLCAEEMGD